MLYILVTSRASSKSGWKYGRRPSCAWSFPTWRAGHQATAGSCRYYFRALLHFLAFTSQSHAHQSSQFLYISSISIQWLLIPFLRSNDPPHPGYCCRSTFKPFTTAASSAFSASNMSFIPSWTAHNAMEAFIGFIPPSRDNSPVIIYCHR